MSLESGVSRSICRRVERAIGPNSVALPVGVGCGKDGLRKERSDLFGLFVELEIAASGRIYKISRLT